MDENKYTDESAPNDDNSSGVNFILGETPQSEDNAEGSDSADANNDGSNEAFESNSGEAEAENNASYGYSDYKNVYEQGPHYYNMRPKKKMSKGLKIAICVLAAIILAAASGTAGAYIALRLNTTASGGSTIMYSSVIRQVSNASNADESLSVQQVADLVSDSVVEITTETVSTGSMMSQYITEGAGSGVIITSDGYIVTNNHVIEDASRITVTLKSGESYEASIIGTDEKTDLAVLKIDAEDLTAAIFGDSSAVNVGDTAIVIGNPLGQLGGSVTTGIISALDRQITINDEVMTLMQTDAAVNPGNSGGGMFNSYGELIGIVNAKSSGTDVEGLGFAIPSNIVKSVTEDIIEHGYVTGRIDPGLTFIDINDLFTAMSYGVNEYGVYILKADEDGNAYREGLRSGMIVTAVNGNEISSVSEINEILDGLNIGDSITITVRSNRGTQDYTYTLGEYTGQ